MRSKKSNRLFSGVMRGLGTNLALGFLVFGAVAVAAWLTHSDPPPPGWALILPVIMLAFSGAITGGAAAAYRLPIATAGIAGLFIGAAVGMFFMMLLPELTAQAGYLFDAGPYGLHFGKQLLIGSMTAINATTGGIASKIYDHHHQRVPNF